MKIIFVNVMTLCCLLLPQLLFAGGEPKEFVMTPRAQKIFDQAPKTPEALLKIIKEFMDNPSMNGYEFGERVSGIDREYWGPESEGNDFRYNKNVLYKSYAPLCGNCPYSYRTAKRTLPTPYFVNDMKVVAENSHFMDISISFQTRKRLMTNMTCEMTPALVQQMLGTPTKIDVTSPTYERSSGRYYLRYYYNFGRYELSIPFLAKGDNEPELRKQRRSQTVEQIRQERKRRKNFANHKDFLALTLRLSRLR
ncbi:MAG: hypothetical protein KQH63_04300 [Desulfobulbaceae bacterium]|nr:hypothetical protein [Desulfobulbaceae bacterium]